MSDLYKTSARVLEGVMNRRGGLKTLAFGGAAQNKRATYAVVAETLKHVPQLQAALDAVGFWKKHVDMNRYMVLLMAHDLLLDGKIKGGGAVKRALREREAELSSAFDRALRSGAGAGAPASLAELRATRQTERSTRRADASALPRYVRLNLLKLATAAEVDEAVAALVQACAEQHTSGDAAAAAALVTADAHVPYLLRLPAGTDLHAHALVESGRVILQDKSSCMPACALLGPLCPPALAAPPCPWPPARLGAAPAPTARPAATPKPLLPSAAAAARFDVIDACAAPGNKTTHAAMLLAQACGGGRVFACERDPKRAQLLRRRVEQAGAGASVSVVEGDVLQLDPLAPEYSSVRCALVDPSCSGSGMVRPDHAADRVDADELQARLESLSQFQERVIWHMLQLPRLTRLTYSTCSVHVKENEAVVARILRRCREQPEGSRLRSVRLGRALPSWHRRGQVAEGLGDAEAASLVRTLQQAPQRGVSDVDNRSAQLVGSGALKRRRESADESAVPPGATPAAAAAGDDTGGFFVALLLLGDERHPEEFADWQSAGGDGTTVLSEEARRARNARRKAKRQRKAGNKASDTGATPAAE